MKKQLILFYMFLLPHCNYAVTQAWSGSLSEGNYIDTNILISGDTELFSGTTMVTAETHDITITVVVKSKVYSNDSGSSTLILNAVNGNTITVQVNETLKFAGVDDELDEPVNVQEQGNGTIQWVVQEGAELIFGSNNDRGGTLLALYYDGTNMPNHIFQPRLHHDQIKFERNAKWGHIINVTGPDVDYYQIIDAVNREGHGVLIQFYNGDAFEYEARFLDV